MSKKLADSIISLRRKHGFSQEQLAEKIGVTRQAISNWERGTATPDVETLNLIAKLFDTDLLAIINGESNEQEKAKDTIPHRTALLIAIIVLMIVHFLLAFLNKIEMDTSGISSGSPLCAVSVNPLYFPSCNCTE